MNMNINVGRLAATALVVAVVCGAGSAGARELRGFEVTPFIGYSWSGKITVYEGDVNIIDKQCYGLLADVPLGRGPYKLEFLYSRMDTNATLYKIPERVTENLFDVAIEYYNIGAIIEPGNKQVRPYGGMTIGAANFNPKTSAYKDHWLFSATLGGGAKAYLSKHVGLRLDLRAMLPMKFDSVGLWVGTDGPDLGVSSNVLPQLNANLGLMITW